MKLKDMLKLPKDCDYKVLNLDSGLHTDYIPNWETDNPQLRTLLGKVVKAVCPEVVTEGTLGSVVLEVANA